MPFTTLMKTPGICLFSRGSLAGSAATLVTANAAITREPSILKCGGRMSMIEVGGMDRCLKKSELDGAYLSIMNLG
jgi:hypothetical protein